MKQNSFSGQYLAPEVKVVVTRSQGVLCASPLQSGGSNFDDYGFVE